MPGCGLWAARPAARVRGRWRPRTKEACSCTHGTTSSIEGRGGRSPARSGNAFRELGADPYTTTKDLDFPEGPVLLKFYALRYRFPVRKHASIFATARCAAGRPHNYHTASAPVPRAPTSHMPPPTTSLPDSHTCGLYMTLTGSHWLAALHTSKGLYTRLKRQSASSSCLSSCSSSSTKPRCAMPMACCLPAASLSRAWRRVVTPPCAKVRTVPGRPGRGSVP